MRRTDPSNKNRPEGNTNTLPPPTYTRIYPRSCKFYSKVVHSEATAGMSGGKAYNRNKSEDLPEYFCLIRSFRVKGDRINELVNCTWCVQGSGHLHAIYLICELP